MNLSRRSFLGGVLSLVAAPAVAKLMPPLVEGQFQSVDGKWWETNPLPVIRGDGVHDDWAGLQALFDGEDFIVTNESLMASQSWLHKGAFRLSRTLVVGRAYAPTLVANHFGTTPDFEGRAILEVIDNSHAVLMGNYIEGDGKATGLLLHGDQYYIEGGSIYGCGIGIEDRSFLGSSRIRS